MDQSKEPASASRTQSSVVTRRQTQQPAQHHCHHPAAIDGGAAAAYNITSSCSQPAILRAAEAEAPQPPLPACGSTLPSTSSARGLPSPSPAPACGLSTSNNCSRQMARKRGHAASRALSRMIVSVLLQRHVLLLLVPLLYFWGMVLMMQEQQQAGAGEEWGMMPLMSYDSAPPSQEFSSRDITTQAAAYMNSWELHSQGGVQLMGMSNITTSLHNFLVHPRGHVLANIIMNWELPAYIV